MEAIMNKLRTWAAVTLALAILSFVLLLFMFLALADISQGEQDLTNEWGLLRLGFFVIFFLIIATFFSTGLVFKYFRDKEKRGGPKPRE
jgi:uncharacterized membrane protein YhaH (DUF805 family)